jgi:zinc protease
MTRALLRAHIALLVGLLLVILPGLGRAAEVQRVVSPGGIEAWLIEEHAIPLISLEAMFRGGSSLDPVGKEGLATLASGMIDEGAGDYDSEAFLARLVDRSIRLSASATQDNIVVGIETLSIHRAAAFEMIGLALTAPRYDPDAIERVRRRLLIDVVQNERDPERFAAMTWYETVYPGHPYGRSLNGTAESVNAITRADLQAFASNRFARDNMIVAVVGDITAAELAPLLDASFGALPATAAPWQIDEADFENAGTLRVVERDIPQSVAFFGLPGIKRADPEFYAAYVMNHILGGGSFTSRLTDEIREKRGLAYSVYSYLIPLRYGGLFVGSVGTRNNRVAESLDLIRAEFDRFRREGASARELADALTHLTGSFALRFDKNARVARTLLAIQYEDLGIDYIERRNDYIEAVTLDDVNRIARRLLVLDALTVVVVGAPVGVEQIMP